ncbi:MAG: hypothetical protein AABM64_12130 [Pseudomonadota bacterium]
MGTDTANLEQAIAGLMAVEKRIIELAEERKIGGLRLEWNDGQDFGHLEDPVPVSIFAPRGKMVEAEFSHAELAQFPAGSHAAIDARIHHVVQGLGEEG